MLRRRYRRILWFFALVIAKLILWELVLPRLGLRRWSRRTRSVRLHRIASAYRALAVQMGGVLIKLGQFLSARVDVLPEEITEELSGLQDQVPPEDFDDLRRVAEEEFGEPLSQKYIHFEEAPVAAASLGQVHRAQISSEGEGLDKGSGNKLEVVVKIQRPNIKTILDTDLAALSRVARWVMRYPPIRRRVDVPALLEELSRVLYEEIDYLAEGSNAETFAASFKDNPGVRVPYVVWSHTTKRVLTLEDVYAIKITDYEGITAAGIDRPEVASRLLNTYLQQIFEDNFFHADPHPGNLFVQPLTEEVASEIGVEWQLTFVDFGMVGRVPPNLRAGLREMVIAVGTRDPKRLIQSYQMLGVLLPSADLELLEQVEARMFQRFWGMSMAELREIGFDEMREFAREFREVIYEMPFQVPQDLIFLGRTVAILSGMCTGLYPQFNFWENIAPFARKLLAEEAESSWEFWLEEIAALLRALVSVPQKLDSVLGEMQGGKLSVRTPEVTERVDRLERSVRRMVGALIFAAFLLGGVQLYLAGLVLFGGIFLAGALVALLWVMLARR